MIIQACLFILLGTLLNGTSGVSLYEYYVPSGTPTSGLVAEGPTFKLNGHDLNIYSGAMHYFRIHPAHWRDTLKKLRACGLNTVETYMSWNLHNPEEGVLDFGKGGNDMSEFLDIRTFIQIAQEEDMFVLLRPGPYICAEWDFGGMPYWLLKDPANNPRTIYEGYTDAITPFYTELGLELSDLTFMNGGPIIGVQIENEYGHFGYEDEPRDKLYLKFVKDQMDLGGFSDTLYFTSDTSMDTKDWGSLPGVLQTTNFQRDVDENINALVEMQPDRPLMVMEFWTGWFDHWLADVHSTIDPDVFASNLELIFLRGSSVNMYMFIGGTNFGFLAGANRGLEGTPSEYSPIVTSYDYDAPLTEAGDYSPKYEKAKDLIALYNPLNLTIDTPEMPEERAKTAFGVFPIEESLDFQELLTQSNDTLASQTVPISMEELGLDYGYVVYTYTAPDLAAGNHTLLIRGHVRDMAQVFVNGAEITKAYKTLLSLNNFGYWNGLDQSSEFSTSTRGPATITIMVENLGRVNYGKPYFFKQKKGLWEGNIMLNGAIVPTWDVTLMGFKKAYINSLTNWSSFTGSLSTPSAYKVTVPITTPTDTFIDMSAWNKGVVFLNGFNLGRYWKEGPQRSLYVPAPLLKTGDNYFVVFEQYDSPTAANITLIDHPLLSRNDS